MALGAIEALKAAGKLDKTIVGGVDATSDALAAMKAGSLKVTVFQDAKGQGGGGVDAAVKLYNGETVPGYVDVPYQLVTPDNMADFAGK
jgi:ABC-type sugar transport system substrate-binding protein